MEDIKSLGLGEYAEELDEKGYTVLPPDIACPDGLKDRLLDACLAVAENRNGKQPDLKPIRLTHRDMRTSLRVR